MSSVVTTSENGLKMKIQRKSQRQVSDIENNNISVTILPPKQKNTIENDLVTKKEDYSENKVIKSDSICAKFPNSKLIHVGKNKCKNKKQTKLAKEKKIKKKLDNIAPMKKCGEKDLIPEG